MSASTDKKYTRQVQGGLTDVYPTRQGWWERYPMEFKDDDIRYTIPPAFSKRPDKIAYAIYGRATYSWVVLQYNSIVDVNLELVTGKEIRLPTLERLTFDILNKQTGGNPVT